MTVNNSIDVGDAEIRLLSEAAGPAIADEEGRRDSG